MDVTWAMNQDAVYRELTGHDGYNRPTYADDISLKVRWQFKQRLVMATNGQEVVSEADVWTPLSVTDPDTGTVTDITPKADDVFVYRGKSYTVLNAGEKVSIYGEESHWKLYCRTMAAE